MYVGNKHCFSKYWRLLSTGLIADCLFCSSQLSMKEEDDSLSITEDVGGGGGGGLLTMMVLMRAYQIDV